MNLAINNKFEWQDPAYANFKFNCSSWRYKLLVANMYFLLKTISMRLVERNFIGLDGREYMNYVLKFNNPFRLNFRKAISNLIYNLFIFYSLIKLIFLFMVQSYQEFIQQKALNQLYSVLKKHDKIYLIRGSNMNLSSSSSSSTSSLLSSFTFSNQNFKCALSDDIESLFKDREKFYPSIVSLNVLLENLSVPYASVTGANIMCYLLVLSVILMYYYYSIIDSTLSTTPLSTVIFIYKPLHERQRIRRNLINLLPMITRSTNRVERNIFAQSLTMYPSDPRELQDTFEQDTLEPIVVHSSSMKSLSTEPSSLANLNSIFKHKRGTVYTVSLRPTNRMDSKSNDNPSSIEITLDEPLVDIGLPDIVKPVCFEAKNHERVVGFTSIFLFVNCILGVFTVVMLTNALVGVELYERAEHRLHQVKCSQWNPGSVALKNFVFLLFNSSPLSAEEEKSYLNCDGSKWSLMKLMVSIESKYYFTTGRIYNILEFYVISGIAFCWVNFYHNLYVISFTNNLSWLNQLVKQLDECLKLLASEIMIEEKQKNYIISINQGKMSLNSPKETEQESQLTRALTLVYLNFELYRRDQKNFSRLTYFLIVQASAVCGVTLLCCYVVSSYIRDTYNLILICLTLWLVLYMEWFVGSSAMKTSKIDKLARSIVRLQTINLIDENHKSYHAMRLWQRQLITEKEARRYFAPTLLGLDLSYSQWISLNGYLVGLVLVVLRFHW